MSLEGKVALVVGGGSGIGKAIALSLAADGAKVAIAGRRFDVLEQVAAESDAEIHCHSVDVADRASVKGLFEFVTKTLGPVDILVNAAGINIKTRSMAEMTPEQWDQVMQINATGGYNLMYEALPPMRERKDGLIINISSISGKRAYALGGIAYCASKFAMTALGTAIGNEVAAEGVRITNIYPGEVETPILAQRPSAPTAEHRARMLQPEDFSEVVLAICHLPPRAHVAELIIKPTKQEYT
ncbi:oxidoreductase [Blastopirellula marina]|uniref:Oxidoreductase n=1 Tax=Blastopirellula marina TaxID=124 RepID=A0A2S8F1D4_9BACT|nr:MULTISPECIES: SDR family oxidoreductase [Pirellulaceae]PQO25907.1 oxidoreductase [Blastopirellula marina]RCS44265.1 SDR family NAD(P)-dependent oxidoreductase [Bremerella cremea]